MSNQDKDELAKLLGAFAAGEHVEETGEQAHEAEDHVGFDASGTDAAPPPPAPSAPAQPKLSAPPAQPAPPKQPAPPPKPVAMRPVVVPKSAAPKPQVATPKPTQPPAARPGTPAAKPAPPPAAPVQPVAAPAPPAPAPAAPPPQPVMPVVESEVSESGEIDEDDVVIVPAPSPEVLAARPAPRPVVRQQHLVQRLEFKRTLIPILLTLGVICPFVGLMGYFVKATSPYARLAEVWFSIPFTLTGLVMLGLGIMTMLQVRHELGRKRS